ncbi:acylneuraminate cytidylyltransferase family protein [Guggenheimella bovis]
MNIAIIPARQGSKRILDKNIKPILGKPLIAYTIEAALKSKRFDRVIVTTDSKEYGEIATRFGAEFHLRSPELSTDTAKSNDVILDVLEHFPSDRFMLLQPTSPLRDETDIEKAFLLFEEKRALSVVSVTECEPLALMNTLDESLSLENFLKKEGVRTQELKKNFVLNGAIYLSDTEHFKAHQTFYGERSFAYMMKKNHSVDIDSMDDFFLAEALIMYEQKSTL